MIPVTARVLSAFLMAIPSNGASRFEASVGVGAGYDSNIALASASSHVDSFGTTTASAWADAGFSFELAAPTRLYAGIRYDGLLAFDAGDLSYQAVGADAYFTQEITDWLALLLTPSIGYSFYGDPARSGVRLLARVVLRVTPWDWLAVRAGYARAQSWASDDVFSLGTDRILAGAEARLARRSYLAVGYALSMGDQVFYEPESTAPPAGGRGRGSPHRGGGPFSTIVPYQAHATENAITARFEQGIWKQLYAALSYEYTLGSSAEGDYVVHSVFGAVGYRF